MRAERRKRRVEVEVEVKTEEKTETESFPTTNNNDPPEEQVSIHIICSLRRVQFVHTCNLDFVL